MSNNLYNAIIKSVGGRVSVYVIQFVFMAIYSRIFTPEEFGIVASIQVFIIFFQMIADVGIGPAIINLKEITNKERDGIFSFCFIVGCVLSVLFFLFSYLLNYFYDGYEYQKIAIIISVSIIFNSLNIIPITAYNKDARFIELAWIDIFTEVICIVGVYCLYVFNFGVIALVSKVFIQSMCKFFLLWFLSKSTVIGRPVFGSELHHIKKIYKFASYQFAFNFINYFSRNLDNILVGKFLGMSLLGVYDKSYQLMRYPLLLTTFAMTPAIQPILVKYQKNITLIIEEHNKLINKIFVMSILIGFFIYNNAYEIVVFMFGMQWTSVVPLIKVFAISIPVQSVLSTSGSFFQVVDKTRYLFISGSISAFFNITAILIGVYYSSLYLLASMLVISFSVNFIFTYHILFKYCFFSPIKSFYIKLFNAIIFVSPVLFLYYFSSKFIPNNDFKLLSNIILSIFILSIYYFCFNKKKVKQLF
ncbi:oligosaccharide flippase family protein [Photobacterium leiognathi]|uniref:oligosaccharide flippase family protein n=1 Tax=Photobacterium leiognathi TaxID=553611 RepID=UPI0029829073|nr:oligosaccharide flippase family protein [Photobacterium leiognathi]